MLRISAFSLVVWAMLAAPSRPAAALESVGDVRQATVELRQQYVAACDALAKVERPKIGSDGFREKLSVWSNAVRAKREAAHALVPPLLYLLTNLPSESDEFSAVRDEIKSLHKEMTGQLNEASRKERSFFANSIWPHLLNEDLAPERAGLFAGLSEPKLLVRMNDKLAEAGTPTEPSGWNVQDTYSLALLRAGRIEDARRENALLLAKTNMNIQRGRLPDGKVNYRNGKRTNQSLRREYLLHRALIEAVAGESDSAKRTLAEVQAIDEDDAIKERQQSITREIHSRIEA